MPIALELTLILVLLATAAGLVPLLFQLRRSARGLDAFLLSTRRDLTQITEDVHASRLRMDNLGVSLQTCLDEVSGFARLVRGVGEGVQSFTSGLRRILDPAANPLAGLIGGIAAAVSLFKHRKRKPDPGPGPAPGSVPG